MLTPKQCRAFDQYLIQQRGISGAILMENAGRGCAQLILDQHRISAAKEPLCASILCGGGNNGGDGFVAARHLVNAGAKIAVVLFSSADQYSGDAKIMLDCLAPLKPNIIHWNENFNDAQIQSVIGTVDGKPCNWCVDAMLGTGVRGPLRPHIVQAITAANQLQLTRFAVDIPTGLDPLTGQPYETVFQADFCGTFVDHKTGFSNTNAQACLGKVSVIDIGFTPTGCHWPPPSP